jgi:hypothetical protein
MIGRDKVVIRPDEQELQALRHGYAQELREKLATGGDKHLADLAAQANSSYLEQDQRAQRAETRATTITAAVSMLLGLVITIGTLQLKGAGPTPPPFIHKLVVVVFLLAIVIPLITAVFNALDVTTAQHGWMRANTVGLVTSRAGLDEGFQVETLADLLAAAKHNEPLADWKFERLGRARRMFRLGLAMLLLHPLSLLVLAALGVGP